MVKLNNSPAFSSCFKKCANKSENYFHQFSNMIRFDQRSLQCSFLKQPVWGQKPEAFLLLMLLSQLSSIQSICWWYSLPSYPSVVVGPLVEWIGVTRTENLTKLGVPAIWSVNYPDIWKVGWSKSPFSSFLKAKSLGIFRLSMIWQQTHHVGTARKGRSTSCTPCLPGGNLVTCMGGWPCKNGPPSCKEDETTVNPSKPML